MRGRSGKPGVFSLGSRDLEPSSRSGNRRDGSGTSDSGSGREAAFAEPRGARRRRRSRCPTIRLRPKSVSACDVRRRRRPAAELYAVDVSIHDVPGLGRRSHPGHGDVYLRPRGIGAARRAAPARLDGADACDAPPGAGGPVLPALSFPSAAPFPKTRTRPLRRIPLKYFPKIRTRPKNAGLLTSPSSRSA